MTGLIVNFRVRAVIALASLGAALPQPTLAAAAEPCPVGVYRLDTDDVVDVAALDDGSLRWLTFSGERGGLQARQGGGWTSTYGWTSRPDSKSISFPACESNSIVFNGHRGRRLSFDIQNFTFESNGVSLAGRLVMPPGSAKVPVVVLVHGSEHDSALNNYVLQRLFPARGIGVFVYDKRGTGQSGGKYTQDFELLASDAVAALHAARLHAGNRQGRIGYQGGSQAGWVLPLAVNRETVDFSIVSFGLAVTILEEDQESVALDMHFHGHSAADASKALELATAGEHVIETAGREGYEAFDALRTKYRSEPWYKDVHGDFLFFILPLDQKQILDAMSKDFNFVEAGTRFRYEPMPALEASRTPQLWVLGTDDLEAPSAETSKRIKSLIAKGKEFTLALYPGAEHGMTEYELDSKGERVSTRFAKGYFQMMADYIRDGRIGGHYGSADIARTDKHSAGGH
jgi:uncharacterized protein